MSPATETPQRGWARRRFFVLLFVFVLLAWASHAATVAFDQFGYSYSDPINLRQLAAQAFSVNPAQVGLSFFTHPFFPFVSLPMLLSLAAIAVLESQPVRRPLATLAIAVISLPIGVLALSAMVGSWSADLDGEWIGEGWPILESFFFWTVALFCYSVPEWRQLSRSRAASGPVAGL